MRTWRPTIAALLLTGTLGACRPSDVLSVPPPAGVLASGAVQSQAGAESVLGGAEATLFDAMDEESIGVLEWSEFLTDEFTFSGEAGLGADYAAIGARIN